jgi:hypothetical protein
MIFSPSRPGVLVLTHLDSHAIYVEAASDLDHLKQDIRSDLHLRRHDCDPLQNAYNVDDRVQIELIDTPSLAKAKELANAKKRQLERARLLINDGSHNPAALFSYH